MLLRGTLFCSVVLDLVCVLCVLFCCVAFGVLVCIGWPCCVVFRFVLFCCFRVGTVLVWVGLC